MRVAAMAVLVLALAGCTLQHGSLTGRSSATTDHDDYVVKPVARFPAYDRGCQEMLDGACQPPRSVAFAGPAAQAPRQVVSARKTIQPQPVPSPTVTSEPPSSPTELVAAPAPAEPPAPKPNGDDSKSADKAAGDGLTDAAIAALIIQANREAYYAAGHSCPCPFDVAPSGRLCGRHSAHSRPGASMRCFAADVTAEQIASYRAKLASKITATWRTTGDGDAIE